MHNNTVTEWDTMNVSDIWKDINFHHTNNLTDLIVFFDQSHFVQECHMQQI